MGKMGALDAIAHHLRTRIILLAEEQKEPQCILFSYAENAIIMFTRTKKKQSWKVGLRKNTKVCFVCKGLGEVYIGDKLSMCPNNMLRTININDKDETCSVVDDKLFFVLGKKGEKVSQHSFPHGVGLLNPMDKSTFRCSGNRYKLKEIIT
jgi:hypothetical protein